MKKSSVFVLAIGLCLALASCDKSDSCGDTTSTYNTNMKAIVDAKCSTCHSVGGAAESNGIFTDYTNMKPHFHHFWEQVNDGKMPPAGSPQLTDAEKAAMECWSDSGYPEK